MNKQDILSVAKKHAICRDVASPDFFEGALLGNGSLGVVACSRPDGIAFYFGHNDIWDIRIAEDHKDKIGTFEEVWNRILNTEGDVHKEEWYQKYVTEVTASYHDYVYPRPYPASSLMLFFDRKEYEVLGHSLDISNGLTTVQLENTAGEKVFIELFVSQEADTLYVRTVDAQGKPFALFRRMNLTPHKPDGGLPEFEVLPNGFMQLLPYNDYQGAPRPGVDKAFSVLYDTDGTTDGGLKGAVSGATCFTVQITEGYCEQVSSVTAVKEACFCAELSKAAAVWQAYWEKSGVQLDDEFLERMWYRNTYFLRCIASADSRCPGLFGNWMYKNIGTAWHGDYHLNYNTQQVFWGMMSANRQELHLPYVRMVEDLVPMSKAWAKDFYRLEGACFPHSAYPVPMSVMPYPSPDWGWEIFETPWTVQSLWWHYTYTQDKELLRTRLYPAMREAAAFLAGYMTREGANPKGDDKYHLFPTIVPELYGLSDGFKLNLDGAVDLAFTKFLFHAILDAISDLGIEQEEAELAATIRRILSAYPEYPTAEAEWGEVYVSVENEDPNKVIYNVPANLVQIFPGEDIDAQSATPEELALAKNSWLHHYNEGGNDLVFYYLVGARLGMLDLEKFKRHVKYCLLPNGTAYDRATLAGGRYGDGMDLGFMGRMGIWLENFSLYAVVNECLMWGHRDVIELFPNWDLNTAASFCSLRTKGAFLVDAACGGGRVEYVRVESERGGEAKIRNPWKKAKDQAGNVYDAPVIALTLNAGDAALLTEAV